MARLVILAAGFLAILAAAHAQETDRDARALFKAWQSLDPPPSSGPWEDYADETGEPTAFYWPSNSGTVFSIKAGEIEIPSHGNWISFWLRGDHSQDLKVKYRTSMQKITLLCSGSYTTAAFTSYMADGSIDISEDYRNPLSHAVRPDTVLWDIMKKFCP